MQNNYILSCNEQIYEMPELDFYAFENIAQQKFYIADISNKAFIDEKELVCMSFYPAECFHQLRGSVDFKFEGQNFFEIFLYNENDHLLDVIRTNVPTEWGEKIVDDAELLKWEDEESDELTASLVNSFRFEKQFAMSFAGAENIALSSSRISYDSYTDSDNIIHEYMDDWVEESYDGSNFLAKKYKERAMESDPIIRIIPDSFFWKSSASYFTCIGKEYGFFIQSAYYEADVFVFDIIHEKASLNSTELEVTVRPLFAASYFIRTPESVVTLSLNKTASLNFSIKNIRLQINLANADEKNRGDNGYIPENDYGAYISDYHLRAKGKTVSNTNVYRTIKTITTGLSLVPFSDSSLNLIKKSGVKAIDIINDFVYENYLEQVDSQYQLTYENLIKSEDGVFVYEDGVSQNDGAALINKYGSLPKSCDISLVGRNCNHSSFDNCREECLTNQNPILANIYLSEDMRYFAGKKYYFKVKSSSEGTYATVLLYTNTAQIYTGINVEGFDDGKNQNIFMIV